MRHRAADVGPPVAPCAAASSQSVVRRPCAGAHCSASPLTVMQQLLAPPTSIGKPSKTTAETQRVQWRAPSLTGRSLTQCRLRQLTITAAHRGADQQ